MTMLPKMANYRGQATISRLRMVYLLVLVKGGWNGLVLAKSSLL